MADGLFQNSNNTFSMPGVAKRTQLVKPQQVNNAGLTALRPNTPTKTGTAQVQSAAANAAQEISSVGPDTTTSEEPVAASPVEPVKSNADIARDAIRALSNSEIIMLLNELVSGELAGVDAQ